MKKVRDGLIAAKPKWISMDYGATERLSNGDWAASVNWNGSTMRARVATDGKVQYGYPQEGFPLFMDSVALLSDARNVDEAYKFLDFIMVPENAALISAFARYANGIAGSEHGDAHRDLVQQRHERRQQIDALLVGQPGDDRGDEHELAPEQAAEEGEDR